MYFSRGSPYVELLIFCVTLAICLLVVQQKTVASRIDRVLDSLAGFLRKRIFFVDDPAIEQRRLDLIRIVFGLVALARNGLNLATALDLGTPAVIMATAAATLLSASLTVGFMAPLAAGVLGILLNTFFDIVSDTFNLASIVASMCCMALALAPVGKSLSIDALILRSHTVAGRIWRWFYEDFWGSLTLNRAAIAKGALMLAYGGISFSSGLLHLQAENWRRGITNAWVFINPVMNPDYYAQAEWLYAWSPLVYLAVVRLTVYGTLIFQLGFVPLLLLSRWTRRLVILLELGSAAGSVTVLALHLLGWFQLGMCVILFWNEFRLNVGKRDSVAVIYDDQDGVWDRTVRSLTAVDLFMIVELRPLSSSLALAEANGIGHTTPLTDLFGIDRAGRLYRGYELYVLLARRILLLLPLWPILLIGRASGIGPWLYTYAAARRRERFGVRETPTFTPQAVPEQKILRTEGYTGFPSIVRGFALTFAIMFCAFATQLPLKKWLPRFGTVISASEQVFGHAQYAFGLTQVDAFNFPPLSGTLPAFELSWGRDERERRFLFSVPASHAAIYVSDMLFYQVQTTFNYMRYDGTCFTPEFAEALKNRLAVRAFLGRREFAGGAFQLRMKAYEIPDAAAFLTYRYMPLRWHDVCEVKFPANDLQPLTFAYFQDGIDAMAARSPLPFSVAVSAIPLARTYPCQAEAERVAYWLERSGVTDGAEKGLERARQFVASANTKPPLACLADALATMPLVDTDWNQGHLPPAGASCDRDLAAARALLSANPDTVDEVRRNVELAARDDEHGDTVACLVHTAAARRAYYSALRSDASNQSTAPVTRD